MTNERHSTVSVTYISVFVPFWMQNMVKQKAMRVLKQKRMWVLHFIIVTVSHVRDSELEPNWYIDFANEVDHIWLITASLNLGLCWLIRSLSLPFCTGMPKILLVIYLETVSPLNSLLIIKNLIFNSKKFNVVHVLFMINKQSNLGYLYIKIFAYVAFISWYIAIIGTLVEL